MPTLKAMLDEAVRVLIPGGRVGILHFVVPQRPAGATRVLLRGIATGPGFQIRALTVFEKGIAGVLLEPRVSDNGAADEEGTEA